MNLQKLMRQAQQMQAKIQQEMAAVEVEASAGGGMVTVRMNGHKHLLAVTIDPEVLDASDPAMLQDLVVAAVNEGSRKVDEAVQERVGPMMGGMGGLGGLF
jgi:DNA-binding YbaB/EbfC family protein